MDCHSENWVLIRQASVKQSIAISHRGLFLAPKWVFGFSAGINHEWEEMNPALRISLKPALKPGVTTAKFLKPEEKNNFISWRVINLFIFSGFKNFAVVTPGFKAGFKRVSRGGSTHHPRQAFVMHWCTLCTRLWPVRHLHRC